MNLDHMPNINASVDALLSGIDNTIPLVQEFLKDTSFPLEERWALYLKSESLLPSSWYYPDSLQILTDSPYDELGLDRYQRKTNSDLDEQLRENYSPDDEDEFSAHYNRMYEKRDEWREAVLAEGCGSFTYDW